MLNIVANTPLDLYKKTFLEMHKLDDIHNDPRNYKDVTAILSLLNYTQDPNVYLDENGFVSEFNYDEYIAGGNDWAKREIDHYNNEFVKSGKIDFLIKFFEHDPHTRRGVIDLWNNYELSSDKSFPCTVYAWFRKIGNELNMNYHMRAMLIKFFLWTCT